MDTFKNACPSAGAKLFRNVLSDPGNIPVRFRYDGKEYRGLGGLNARKMTVGGGDRQKAVITAALDREVTVRVEASLVVPYGQCEYTVWFENNGSEPSKVISDVYALDMRFQGRDPVLRGCMGDQQNYYSAYEHDCTVADKYFISYGGLSTHVVFPYFDLVHGNGGTLIAVGWAGTWEGLFSAGDSGTEVRIKTDISLSASLLPGEKIRTGQIVLLPYRGRNADDAANLWRRWYMEYILPKANGKGDPIVPFSTSCFAADTGLPNSDGSISERYFTWKPTLDKLAAENVLPDFRWFDAGWYSDPEGSTVEEDWWGTVGAWRIDREKWPGDSFRESNDACHRLGTKVLVWFEPERVTNVPALCRNHGYKEEWAIGDGPSRTNDLGNPECLSWTLKRITDFMEEHGVDLYREDNNCEPGYIWPSKDSLETEKYGIPRYGITENKCICGHYALWDGIIDYCGKHGKCTFVDSCAGGGGRNDIESMRRGVPLLRSDFDRTFSSVRLSMTSSFCKWIPFHGSHTKESDNEHTYKDNRGSTPYVSRASFLPVYNYGGGFTHNELLDFDLLRRNLDEWRSVNRLLTKDMYVLTPWRHHTDRTHWTAFAYDDPDSSESVLLAFRMEEAEDDSFTAKLPFAAGEKYSVRNADTGETAAVSGKQLRDGFKINLPEKKSSALFYISRTE